MPGSAYGSLFDIAEEQLGYVTTAQAEAAGVSRPALSKMVSRGVLQRMDTGVYRLVQYPPSPLELFMEAVLWPYGMRGVISHESALSLYELSDVNPSKIHITVPSGFRIQRSVPSVYVIHHQVLEEHEVTTHRGIDVTTVPRAIRDCNDSGLGADLTSQAVKDALREGYLASNQASRLYRELGLGEDP